VVGRLEEVGFRLKERGKRKKHVMNKFITYYPSQKKTQGTFQEAMIKTKGIK